MALNVKVGLVGALDMLKFKNMAKVREEAIQAAPAREVDGNFTINTKAKELHPDCQELVVCKVIDHDEAGAKTFVLKRPDGKPVAYFRAGQYLSLKMQIGTSFITRPYSISSSPKLALEGKYCITVKTNPGGFAADYMLENLHLGNKIVVSDPQGQFYYEDLRDGYNILALAGGSGITPFLSMARAIRDGIEKFNLTILFGSRTEDSILFKEELCEISKVCPKVKVVHVLSDEEKDGFEHGFITAELIRKYLLDNSSIFICGPEAMYRFLDGEIPKLGLPKRLVRREILGVTKHVEDHEGYPAECIGKTFTIRVCRGPEETEIPAAAGESVLVALERAGIKAPSRCRSGECGWCRSKLVSGDVFIPEETDGRRWADKEHNYIHPCASFPVSDLVLEVAGEYLEQ